MPKENRSASLALQRAKEGLPIQKPSSYPDIVIPKSNLSKARMDSWANETTGFGIKHATNNSKFFRQNRKREVELTSLYEDDWSTRKGVDMPAEDMTRKGISFLHNDDDENSLETVENLEDILINDWEWVKVETEAIKFQRLSGGCATFFNFGGTEEDQRDPIDESQIREINHIRNFPTWLAIPLSWYTEFGHPKQGQPEHYQLLFRDPSSSRTVVVHETRLLIMQGETISPDSKAANRGWNDSPIQSIYNALRDFGVASSSVSGIMQDFNWFSLGIMGLADKVMHGDSEDTILERIYLARQKLHSGNLSLYDADGETMERHGTPVTGLDGLWDRTGDVICAAWGIPRSLFFSSETGSLGGDASESDRANYYDRIGSKQETQSRPWKNDFIHFVSLVNSIDDSDIKYTFNPIKTKTDTEKFTERKTVAETDVVYINAGVISAQEVAESRFSKPEIDLNTMNLDFDEREAQRELEEFSQENENTLSDLEIESQEIDNKNKKGEEPEEKKDSVSHIINVTPEINVAAPIIPEFPKPENNEELIKSISARLDNIEAKKEEIKIKFEE